MAPCWLAIFFRHRFDEWPNLIKKLLAAFDLLAHVLLVELYEFDVVAFLPVPEQPVVQIAMLPGEPTGLNEVLVKGRSHTAMLLESTLFFQKQSAYGIKKA